VDTSLLEIGVPDLPLEVGVDTLTLEVGVVFFMEEVELGVACLRQLVSVLLMEVGRASLDFLGFGASSSES